MKPGSLATLPGEGYAVIVEDVRMEFRYLRRDSQQQLHAEVSVDCPWAPRHIDGETIIACSYWNLSSQSARKGQATWCARRSGSLIKASKKRRDEAAISDEDSSYDWDGVIDAACRQVIQAERAGTKAIVLDDAPNEGPPPDFVVHGLSIPSDSHSLLVCDGDGMKSLSLLLVLGEMARQGMTVLYVDWEWTDVRHKARKRRLFGTERLERLHYYHPRHSLVAEQDHIRRICAERGVQFIAIDSIGAACDGKLADDDVARSYNRALDQLPPSLAAAHVPKASAEDPETPEAIVKPFGSAFFSNYTRMSWNVKKQLGVDKDVATALYLPGKQNDGTRRKPVCLQFAFSAERIGVRNVDPVSIAAYQQTLPLLHRLAHVLEGGAMTIIAMAKELDAKPDSIEKTLKRHPGKFICVSGKDGIYRWGLLDSRAS